MSRTAPRSLRPKTLWKVGRVVVGEPESSIFELPKTSVLGSQPAPKGDSRVADIFRLFRVMVPPTHES